MKTVQSELSELSRWIPSGSRVGLGGMLSERRPVAALVALALGGVRDLEVVSLTGSIDVDLAVGLGAIRTVRSSFVSLGLHGMASGLAAAQAAGAVRVPVETEMSLVAGLRAAIAGTGFMPMRAWDGTDMRAARPDIRTVTCPYTGRELVAFPAIHLDAAVVHVPFADRSGTCFVASDLGIDVELLRAATTRIVTAERIVDDVTQLDVHALGGSLIAGFDVDVLVEVPQGAMPTGCAPLYGPDHHLISEYVNGGATRTTDLVASVLGART